MSGVNRAVLSELAAKGQVSEETYHAAFTPAAIRAETGRAVDAPGAEGDKYTGKASI